jgi:hypothetical protein
MYDTEVGIKKQNADTAASKTELDWNKYFGELGEQQTAWFRDSLAAGFSAQESGEDPTEAMINSLDINMPGGRDEVLAAYPDIKWDEETASAGLSSAEEWLKRQPRRTLSLEESMAIPGMTEDRARNAVVQEDQNGQIYIDDAPTGLTAEDLAARGPTDDKTTNRKVQEANHSARNLVDLTNRVLAQIDAIPQGGLGLTGKGVRGLDEVGAELAGMFEILGGVEEVDGKVVETGTLLDPNLYTWSGAMANASAAVKSNYVTLAYLKAKTLDPGGRLAKDDVALSMQSLGGDWASKGKMQAALNETKWQALNGLKNYYKSLEKPEMFPQDLQNMLSELQPSTFSDDKIVINSSDDAAYEALPSGAIFFDETGKQWTKP